MPEDQSTNTETETQETKEIKEAPKWHEDLSKKFGVDVSGFSDESNALSAIRMVAENSARSGVHSEPATETPAQTPEATKTPEITAESLGLDKDDLDNPMLKAFQAMSTKQDKQIADLQAAHAKQMQEATIDSSSVNGAANAQTANAMIDKIASPRYGVAANRTVPQQLAVNRVFEIAELIHKGGSVQGASVENIVEMAILSDTGVAMDSVQGNPPPEPKSGGGAGEKKIYGKKPPTKRGDDPNDPMGFKQDPVFRERFRRILESP